MSKNEVRAVLQLYPSTIEGEVFGQGRRERIAALSELYPHIIHAGNFDEHAACVGRYRGNFRHLGHDEFPLLPSARKLPKLKAVFYAAGNVKAFAPSLIENGIVLVERMGDQRHPHPPKWCLSQILLSLRGYSGQCGNIASRKVSTPKNTGGPA